jgi:hypothetical protein
MMGFRFSQETASFKNMQRRDRVSSARFGRMPALIPESVPMYEIVTEIEINAAAPKVWSVLTDFKNHPEWNPFIREIDGPLRPGATLTVRIAPPGRRAMTFRPKVLRADTDRELRWRGRVLVPGVFDGEHYFRIIPTAPDKTRLVHGERFSGLLLPLLRASLDGATWDGFVAMNEALKARAESDAR